MLHNSGPYGPNDVPINMGMPVNMSQMSNPMNLGNNLGNLAKMPQQVPQTVASDYGMPDYSSFGHPPLNMGHPLSSYPNFHPLTFQTNYVHPNPNLPHNTAPSNLENNILPINLNTQSDHGPSLVNYNNFESKILDVNNTHYRDTVNRRVPINIPQIHTKAFHKHVGMDADLDQFNPAQEKPFYNHDLSKTPEKSLLDSSKRKSLENTVKLIENILINSTPKDILKNEDKESSSHSNDEDVLSKEYRNKQRGNDEKQSANHSILHKALSKHNPKATNLQTTTDKGEKSDIQDFSINSNNKKSSPKSIKEKKLQDTNVKTDTKITKQNDTITSINLSKNNELSENMGKNDTNQSEIHCKPLKRSLINNNRKSEEKLRDSNGESDSETEELITEVNIKQEVVEDVVQIKIELMESNDGEIPFLKDNNATSKDVLEIDAVIIEEDSVAKAKESAKMGSDPKTYFECSHCNLIFKHPKRFLIHTKWHTFGLTNEKRHRMEKEKEIRKTMKKEARIIERLNAKEVKPGAEGETHPCKDCDKVFSLKSSLKNHRQKYHPTRVRECKVCQQAVVGWMALRAHMAAHAAGTGFSCPDCPKRFKYAHSLAKHRDTHLEKTHSCDQCSKKFGSQALLKMHMKCHERTARGATFRCTYCGKGFFESYNLQVHERTHRNERPFTCDICKSSFGTNSSLKRHVKVSHSTSKPFACPTCHRHFASATTRSRHTTRAHGDSSAFPHKCTLCPRQYTASKELHKHMGKAHKEERDRGETA